MKEVIALLKHSFQIMNRKAFGKVHGSQRVILDTMVFNSQLPWEENRVSISLCT
jgi:hypothetical protein